MELGHSYGRNNRDPTTLSWVFAFTMVSKNVFGPAFSSGFRHKYTMHTRLWEVCKLFERLKAIDRFLFLHCRKQMFRFAIRYWMII